MHTPSYNYSKLRYNSVFKSLMNWYKMYVQYTSVITKINISNLHVSKLTELLIILDDDV